MRSRPRGGGVAVLLSSAEHVPVRSRRILLRGAAPFSQARGAVTFEARSFDSGGVPPALRTREQMIIAIDTNAILPGQVGGIENYTLGLIEALKLPGSPASRLFLLT